MVRSATRQGEPWAVVDAALGLVMMALEICFREGSSGLYLSRA